MRTYRVCLVLIVVAGLMAGCGAAGSSHGVEAAEGAVPAIAGSGNSEDGTLADSSQLAFGTLKLEGTENAVTPQQAGTLLPLWQALQSGGLRNEAESAAVLKQIQGAMTAEQLAAITAMELTAEDVATWMQELGIDFAPPEDAQDTSGRPAPPGGLDEENMAAMRATAEAGGGIPAGGGAFGAPGDMSEEERAAMRATAEAGGITPGGGRGMAGGGGPLTMVAQKVIELLAERAAQ